MSQLVLILGSNKGNKKEFLDQAKNLLRLDIGEITKESALYETAAWGMDPENEEERMFLNQVIVIDCSENANILLQKIKRIELMLGRKREKLVGYSSRTIDIDILFYDHMIFNTSDLVIPHPQIPFRRFVLLPLAEIMPQYVHPSLGKNIETLLKECPDKLEVVKK